jgi:hypothetical protein
MDNRAACVFLDSRFRGNDRLGIFGGYVMTTQYDREKAL